MAEIAERTTTTGLASESGHWYRRDGSPCYEIMGKTTGKMRPVTIRDARELQLVPGVTGVIGLIAKPALKQYWQREAVKAALGTPRLIGESDDEFMTRVLTVADEHAANARDVGTQVHAAFEQNVRDEPFDMQWQAHVALMHRAIIQKVGMRLWSPEHSYAHSRGYGCKLDIVSSEDNGLLIDHKGKDGPLEGQKTWPEHWMQCAAGRRAAGIPRARCFINFFRRDAPEALCVEIKPEELEMGLAMFDCLLDLWQIKNKYRSGWQE